MFSLFSIFLNGGINIYGRLKGINLLAQAETGLMLNYKFVQLGIHDLGKNINEI
jgi:hypothetical protein